MKKDTIVVVKKFYLINAQVTGLYFHVLMCTLIAFFAKLSYKVQTILTILIIGWSESNHLPQIFLILTGALILDWGGVGIAPDHRLLQMSP